MRASQSEERWLKGRELIRLFRVNKEDVLRGCILQSLFLIMDHAKLV